MSLIPRPGADKASGSFTLITCLGDDEEDATLKALSSRLFEALKEQSCAAGGGAKMERPKSASLHGRTKGFDLDAFLKEEASEEKACHLAFACSGESPVHLSAKAAHTAQDLLAEDDFYERQEAELEALIQGSKAKAADAASLSEEVLAVRQMFEGAVSCAAIAHQTFLKTLICLEKSPQDLELQAKLKEDDARFIEQFERTQAALGAAISINYVHAKVEEGIDPSILLSAQTHEIIFYNSFAIALNQERELKEDYDAVLEDLQENPILPSLHAEKRELEENLSEVIAVVEKLIDTAKALGLTIELFEVPPHIYKKLHELSLDKLKRVYIDMMFAKIEKETDPTNAAFIERVSSCEVIHAEMTLKGMELYHKTPDAHELKAVMDASLHDTQTELAFHKAIYKAVFQELLEIGKFHNKELAAINGKLLTNPENPIFLLQKTSLERLIDIVIKAGVLSIELCETHGIDLSEFGIEPKEPDLIGEAPAAVLGATSLSEDLNDVD